MPRLPRDEGRERRSRIPPRGLSRQSVARLPEVSHAVGAGRRAAHVVHGSSHSRSRSGGGEMSGPAAVENREARSRRLRVVFAAIAVVALAIVAGNLVIFRGSAHAKLAKAAREAVRTQKYEEARPILDDWLAKEP